MALVFGALQCVPAPQCTANSESNPLDPCLRMYSKTHLIHNATAAQGSCRLQQYLVAEVHALNRTCSIHVYAGSRLRIRQALPYALDGGSIRSGLACSPV